MDNAQFFNNNAEFYGAKHIYEYDDYLIEFIKRTGGMESQILDLGGGSGLFASMLKTHFPDADIGILDPSTRLMDQIPDKSIKTHTGELPNNIELEDTFDYIHIKEVLHHVTDRSPQSSKELVKASLRNMKSLLKKNGHLMVHELYYEGHIDPTSTRNIIFGLLKIQNKLGIRIPQKEFIPGLSVCFFTRDELCQMITESGYRIVEVKEYPWVTPTKLTFETIRTKCMLLREWGRIVVICQKEQ